MLLLLPCELAEDLAQQSRMRAIVKPLILPCLLLFSNDVSMQYTSGII